MPESPELSFGVNSKWFKNTSVKWAADKINTNSRTLLQLEKALVVNFTVCKEDA